jgi:tetratricopeptide (TPR) repeat protein
MSEEPTAAEIQLRLRELLGRATLMRARGERQQALQLAQEALVLDQRSWEAHELMGDILLDLGRGQPALESYRQARELNRSRAVLEEKIGRAALARAARLQAANLSEALLEGRAREAGPPRKPGFAALLSLIVPGLGQLYNGEVAKGFIMLAAFMLLFAVTGVSLRGQMAVTPISPQGALYGRQIDATSVLSGLFSGVSAIWVVLLLAVWIYSIADAGIKASRSMTSDHTGLV